MSVDRIHGRLVFICDSCDETLETDERDLTDANTVRKDARWAAVKSELGLWRHFCPDCNHN